MPKAPKREPLVGARAANSGVIGRPSEKIWSTFDSGATLMCRPREEMDVGQEVRTMKVGLAAGQMGSAVELKSGECIMDVDPLCPVGRSVRIGRYCSIWTPNFGPCIVQLSESEEKQIADIWKSHPNRIEPTVIHDIPYLTKSQTRVLRDAMDLRNVATKREGWVAKSMKTLLTERNSNAQSMVKYLGKPCIGLYQELCSNKILREVLDFALASGEVSRSDINREWKRCRSVAEFENSIEECIRQDNHDPVVFDVEFSTHKTGHGSTAESAPTEPKTVRFGDIDTVTFEYDGGSDCGSEGNIIIPEEGLDFKCLLAAKKERTQKSALLCPLALTDCQQHCITHRPSRVDCDVCQSTKKTHKPKIVGSATAGGKADGRRRFVMDWVTPREISSTGCRYLCVVGDVETGAIWAEGFPHKRDNKSVVALHNARVAWRLEGCKWSLHTDGEKVLIGESMATYARGNGGVTSAGVANRSDTNAHAENYCRQASEGIRAFLYQSSIPIRWWPVAALAFSVGHSRDRGLGPSLQELIRHAECRLAHWERRWPLVV